MPAVTKHIYDRQIFDIHLMWNKQLKQIANILPHKYDEKIIISTIKEFFPYEWQFVENCYEYYKIKDKYIEHFKGKKRYNMPTPCKLIQKNIIYRRLMSINVQQNYFRNYNYDTVQSERAKLYQKRKKAIDKVDNKIQLAKLKTQQVTPEFLDKLIGLYQRKRTTQKDKVYIITELKKYYSKDIIQFFLKVNDTEINRQLREIAFYHLQSFNYHPRLRKQKYMQVHTKNKKEKEYLKKIYPYEKYSIPFTPEELEYRIGYGREQLIKEFDFFISHSSVDSASVQKLVNYENKNKVNIFCDWINDADYLKRSLVCKATLKVIEKRLEQSKAVIFVLSDDSLKSIWCKYELNYFKELNRPIYVISTSDIEKDNYQLNQYNDNWYIDPNYKELALIHGKEIGKNNE